GTTSTPVTVNANVLSSCMFDTTATSAASFTYDAIVGTTGAVSGGATLYCNAGTSLTVNTAATGAVVLNSASKSKSLNATYALTSVANAGAGTGSYAGADQYVYTLAATAAAGQWGAPTAADYTGSVDINVTF
ncbi:hypothetical protein K7W42_22790, partial [Deinococcus sp. HMF7604]|uniref:hypothetical protein n=1 Tax=Deinococcus betulae TaxID=2873312 RepID=UPI001CCE2092